MKFPMIMISKNEYRTIVVLFDSAKCRTVLECSDDEYELAEYLEFWNMDLFEIHNQPVTLSN